MNPLLFTSLFHKATFPLEGLQMPIDPLTAAMNALAAFNAFLCTPPGQKFAEVNNQLIVDILTKLHVHIVPDVSKG